MRSKYHGQTIQLKWEPVGGGSRIPQTAMPTSKFGMKTYYWTRFSPKPAWKWKKLDREGARIPSAPLDSPMPVRRIELYAKDYVEIHTIARWSRTRPLSVTLTDDGATSCVTSTADVIPNGAHGISNQVFMHCGALYEPWISTHQRTCNGMRRYHKNNSRETSNLIFK